MRKLILAATAAASLVTGSAFASGTPDCDSLDHGNRYDVDTRLDFDFENGDLFFNEDGKTRMRITEDRELYLDGERIELDAKGRELVDRYYIVVEEFVDDVTDLAGNAAGLGVSAAVQALVAVVSGDEEMDDFEKRMEERAHGIELQANALCKGFQRIEGIERAMQNVIPGFVPVMFPAEAAI